MDFRFNAFRVHKVGIITGFWVWSLKRAGVWFIVDDSVSLVVVTSQGWMLKIPHDLRISYRNS